MHHESPEPWPAGKLFFVDIEFQASGGLFHRLGVASLPHVFRLPPSLVVEGDGPIKLKPDDVMKHADYAKFPWEAEDFASFVQEKVRLQPANRWPACTADDCDPEPSMHLPPPGSHQLFASSCTWDCNTQARRCAG